MKKNARVVKGVFPKGSLVKNSVVEAEQEAAEIRRNAEEYAAEIVREAHQSAKDLKEAGYKEGFESGLSELIENVVATAKIREHAVNEAEEQIIELSVAIARRIIGKELASREDAVIDIVESGIRHVRHKHKLLIRVNPLDVETVVLESERLEKRTGGRYIDVVPDTDVAAGGCIIESESGTVDARVETQLRVLQRGLLKVRGKFKGSVDE